MSRPTQGDGDQYRDTPENVDRVRRREYIEKTAAGVRRDADPGGTELAPADPQPYQKKKPQHCRNSPPMAETRLVVREQAGSRASQREAPCQQDRRSERENAPRQIQPLPIA